MKRHAEHLADMLGDPIDRRHGTAYGYRLGCRCDRCRDGWREYKRDLQRHHDVRFRSKPKPKQPEVAERVQEAKRVRKAQARADICTLNELLLPMMGKPSISFDPPRCAVCGKTWPLNNHHIVRRSAGVLIRDGREVRKPTVMLCGSGNTSGCHGMAHHGRLHFRWRDADGVNDLGFTAWGGGHWEYLLTEGPVKYQDALAMDGWRRL